MRIGTLFSGIGAPEQGAKRVYGDDLKMVFACEWDKFARQSFEAIYDIEDEHFHKDINDMDGKQYAGKVDCIIGGSPCQDFSIAGLRAGVDGHRGQLIWQYFRIIDEVRPPVFIYENVKGMTSDKNGKTIQDFLEVFRSIGYFCHWDVLNTKDYGIPQNRERVFIVGFLDHEAYYRFQFAPKQKLEKRLKDILESNVDEKYYLSAKMVDYLQTKPRAVKPYDGTQSEAPCLQAVYYKTPTDGFYVNEGVVGMLDIKGNEQIRRAYGTDGSAPYLQTMQGGNREPKILQRGRGFNDGGLHEISPTLTINSWQENNHLIEGDTDAKKIAKYTAKALRILWEWNATKTIQQWKNGEHIRVYEAEVLHEGMFGQAFGKDWESPSSLLQQFTHNCENHSRVDAEYEYLRKMWIGFKNRYSSQRRKLDEQQQRELASTMPKLSLKRASDKAQLQSGWMQYKSKRAWVLREALSEIQKMGKPINGKEAEKQDYRIRKLTPLEVWRLQDFPDEAHEKAKAAGVSDSRRYQQAGNSITVAVIEMIFRQIDKAISGETNGGLF